MLLTNSDRVRYELDITAKNPDNLVVSERIKTKNQLNRILVPKYGAFYINSVKLTDVKTGKVIPKTSYMFEDPSVVVAEKTGHPAAHTIKLSDTTVGDEIDMTYQVVGGIYSIDKMDVIYQRLLDANLDSRPVEWVNISGKPSEYNPTEHFHDAAEEIYGLEKLVYVLERYVRAQLIGDEASHDVIWDALNDLDKRVTDNYNTLNTSINTHKLDYNNPHKVTPAQIGTMTSAQITAAIKIVDDALKLHIANKNNPHGVTPAQIGTMTTKEIMDAIDAIKSIIVGDLNDHLGNFNNPHKVTAAQVGSYTKAEANAITNKITTDLSAHVNNKLNPHGVTAAQVGSYTKAETNTQITTTIANGVAKDLSAHISNKSNPHGVTAAQVGTMTTAAITAAIKVVQDALNTHTANKSNPHGVTAAQVGTMTTAQITSADTALEARVKAYVDTKFNAILQTNGMIKPAVIPLSATAGNELKRNTDGLFFQVATSAWAVTNGWVQRESNGYVVWRNQAGTIKTNLFPATWA